jgi:hypothetical protein
MAEGEPLYDVERPLISPEFARCCKAAARHLAAQLHDGSINWLKLAFGAPSLEHLSFRLGNQLFFIRIEDVDENLEVPVGPEGVLKVADGCNGIPCLMPMRLCAGDWVPDAPGWGLVHARTGNVVDPFALVSAELIEMTDWEVHDFAVQCVWNHLADAKRELMSRQGHPEVDPAIWFVGDSGPEWVVVRAVRYPQLDAAPPPHAYWRQLAEKCAALGKVGHFASVSVANVDDAFAPHDVPATPLWRGHGMRVRFKGLARPPRGSWWRWRR